MINKSSILMDTAMNSMNSPGFRPVAIAKDHLRHGQPLATAPRQHQLPQRRAARRAEVQGTAPRVAEGHDAHRHGVGDTGGLEIGDLEIQRLDYDLLYIYIYICTCNTPTYISYVATI